MDGIKSWILTIAVCAMVIEVLSIVLPEGKMEGTAKIVFGIVLSICIVSPAVSFYNQLKSLDLDYKKSLSGIYENKEIYTEEQIIEVTEEFKTRIKEHIRKKVNSIDGVKDCSVSVIIEEDYNSEKYGTLYRVYVTAEEGKEEQGDKKNDSGFLSFGKIEKIEIDIGGITIIEREDETDEFDGLKKSIISVINEEFKIGEENIFAEVEHE